MRFDAGVRIPVELHSSLRKQQLLRKEKDEASHPNCFRLDSFNAFISRFAELKVFYFSNLQFPLVSQLKTVLRKIISRNKIERLEK